MAYEASIDVRGTAWWVRNAAAELLNGVEGVELSSAGSVISGLGSDAVVEVYVDDESSIPAEAGRALGRRQTDAASAAV
jgi:hypothetical protein